MFPSHSFPCTSAVVPRFSLTRPAKFAYQAFICLIYMPNSLCDQPNQSKLLFFTSPFSGTDSNSFPANENTNAFSLPVVLIQPYADWD